MSISATDMARYREKAKKLDLPPAVADEAILALRMLIDNRIDAAFDEDSVQLSSGKTDKISGGTQKEHASVLSEPSDKSGK